MKNALTLLMTMLSAMIYAQSCDPIDVGSTYESDQYHSGILLQDTALNTLSVKVGIGPLGDVATRSYSPLIASNHLWIAGVSPTGEYLSAVGAGANSDWRMGPLDQNGNTNAGTCQEWNRTFQVTREEVLLAFDIFTNHMGCEEMPQRVLEWPAQGNPHLSIIPDNATDLAAFYDYDQDGIYDPCQGDLPIIPEMDDEWQDVNTLKRQLPKEITYYIMNDNGGEHLVSQSSSMQMQVGVYQFSYTNRSLTDINYTTYQIMHRGSQDLRDVYIGIWDDFQIGCPEHDLLGSAPSRDMIYAYPRPHPTNDCDMSLADDRLAVGVSLIRGTRAPFNIVTIDGQDTLVPPSPGSGTFDTLVQLGMTSATIPVNCDITSCTPTEPLEYYHLLQGRRVDGSYPTAPNGESTRFPYSDLPHVEDGYHLLNSSDMPSTVGILNQGPIQLAPGARTQITIATFSADETEFHCSAAEELRMRQEGAKALYDRKYILPSGPPPPTISGHITETGSIELEISDIPYAFSELIVHHDGVSDPYYHFEGIEIYQVLHPDFDISEISNPYLSRVVYQGDIENEIDDLFNWNIHCDKIFSPVLGVEGENMGIEDKITLESDFFTGLPFDQDESYYFVARSYAYNEWQEFNPLIDTGQSYPYQPSTVGVKVTTIDSSQIHTNTSAVETDTYLFKQLVDGFYIGVSESPLQVKIIDIAGRTLWTTSIDPGTEYLYHTSNHSLSNGVYIVEIRDIQRQTIQSHKIPLIN